MKTGAFALIDCLGFKGIWKDGEHSALISKLQSISKAAEIAAKKRVFPNGLSEEKPENEKPQLEIRLLSDTVAISLCSEKPEVGVFTLMTMTMIIQDLISLYIEKPPYLLLRGCITYGKHTTAENFLVGPAVDEAAEYMNSAEGAFIWFLPAATNVIQKFCDERSQMPEEKNPKIITAALDALFPNYQIPIKNSHYLKSRIVNPLYMKSIDDSEKIINSYKDAMKVEGNMSIWMKRQNTLELLDYCKDKNALLSKLVSDK